MATPSADQRNFSQDSFNRPGMNMFILSMVVSIGFFILLLIFHHGVDLKEVAEKAPSAAAAPISDAAQMGTKTEPSQASPSGGQVPANTAPGAAVAPATK